MAGTTIAQAIPIAISPILTRIYSPEDFGVFALYISIASMISVLATGRYELAIMLPKKDEDAANILVLSIIISFFVSSIALLGVFIFNENITNLLGNKEISNWLYFIPVTVLFTGIYQSFNYWLNRKQQYKRLANSKVVQSGATSATTLGMGFAGLGSVGLIFGGIFGQGVTVAILGKIIIKEDRSRLRAAKKLKILALIKRYKKFPIYNLPNALIDGFRLSGIMILIAKFYTTATLGQFSLAWRMLQMPISLMGSALSQVFFQKIASVKKSDLNQIVKAFMLKSAFMSAPIFLIIYFFAIDIFTIVFGENWKLAGEAASIMAPWLFLNFISMPMANVLIVLNRQEVVLMVALFYMLIPLGILLALNEIGFLHVLELITLSMSLTLLAYIGLVLVYIKKEESCGL